MARIYQQLLQRSRRILGGIVMCDKRLAKDNISYAVKTKLQQFNEFFLALFHGEIR